MAYILRQTYNYYTFLVEYTGNWAFARPSHLTINAFMRYNNSLKNHGQNGIIADPRTTDWPLVQNPLMVTGIILAWLYFVLSFGPKWMRNRPAFKLKNLLIVYNSIQIVANIAVWIYVSVGRAAHLHASMVFFLQYKYTRKLNRFGYFD